MPPASQDDVLEVKPGHTYYVMTEACYTNLFGVCRQHRPYTQTIWIEDEATGEVLAGDKWQ